MAPLGEFPVYNLGGGLGVAYTAAEHPPRHRRVRRGAVGAAHELLGPDKRLLIEPGRALVANSTVTLYTVETRQAQRLDLGRGRRRHVGQPAPDALRRASTRR